VSPSPPLETPWVPLWPVSAAPSIPTPVEGYWLKGAPGGAMVWSPAPSPPPGYVTPDTAWQIAGTAAGFQNGWANYVAPYGPVRWRKLASGLVLMEGLMQSGTLGATAITLPVGWRPAKQADGSYRDYIFCCASAAGTAPGENVRINSNGGLVVSGTGSNSWIDMCAIRFFAEPT
jgi:hypothetical protein